MQPAPYRTLASPKEIKKYAQEWRLDCQGLTGTSWPDPCQHKGWSQLSTDKECHPPPGPC